MDVINVLQPTNELARPRLGPRRRSPAASRPAVRVGDGPGPEARISLSEALSSPTIASVPFAVLALAALLVSLAPIMQHRLGHYAIGSVSFEPDPYLENSMRLLGEGERVTVAEDGSVSIPESIRPVSFSSYAVRRGDTVSSIAARFGLRNLGTVLAANGIDNARRLTVGQSLQIPSMDGLLVRVTKGDSLNAIASRYGVPVTVLLDANDLAASELSVGQRLFVPGATMRASELRRALGVLFMMPIRGRLTSGFGYRRDPFTGARTFHTGIDLAAPQGTPVKATLEGKVATTGYSPVYGNYVILTHDGGYQSLYAHLSVISTERGKRVSQGSVVGKVGNTGYSTGSHLHFSLYKNGRMIDPRSMVN